MKAHLNGYVDLGNLKGFIDLDITIEDESIDTTGHPIPVIQPKKLSKTKYIAGENLKLGEMLYLDTSDQAFRATALINCGDDSTKAMVIGAAKNNAAKGSEVEIAGNGENSRCIIDGSLVIGKCVYLSTIPGRVTATMPTENGTARLKVGIARSPNEIKIDIESPIFNT